MIALILNILHRACSALSNDSCDAIKSFVKSKEIASGGFANKAGTPDVYYTFFGLLCSYVLDIKINNQHNVFLDKLCVDTLNLPDLAAYFQSRNLIKASSLPAFERNSSLSLLSLFPRRSNNRDYALRRFAGQQRLTPYEIYMMMLGCDLSDDKDFVERWIADDAPHFHTLLGGYTNVKEGVDPSLNATAATICILRGMNRDVNADIVQWLKDQQYPNGGFVATPGTAIPDLLSTATALMALHTCDERANYDTADFVESHWRDDGGFAATFMDENTDVEYTFYGLLALGLS